MARRLTRAFRIASVTAAAATLLAACEDPPKDSVQRGYRGVGMVQHYNPEDVQELLAQNQVPEPESPAPDEGPLAKDLYENVKIDALGNLRQAEFTRFMNAITKWVSPEQGCAYCHELSKGFAYDDVYTKKVSRRMIQMTMALNSDWGQKHTKPSGVTCYTCHRGQNVPQNQWFRKPQDKYATRMVGSRAGQNAPSEDVALSSLPNRVFERFLENDYNIRVAGETALPTGNYKSIKQTEGTYGLMMHISKGLGVNCTYCHNSRAWNDWDQSTPQRISAFHGIRMVRDINNNYLNPLEDVLPAKRKGPLGDAGKVNCTTCHQGVYKPLFGANMVQHYPTLDPKTQAAAAAMEQSGDAAKNSASNDGGMN